QRPDPTRGGRAGRGRRCVWHAPRAGDGRDAGRRGRCIGRSGTDRGARLAFLMGRLHVRVQPGARTTGFVGWFGELPKLAVTAPPVDGAANEAAIAALADAFGRRPR